MLEFEWSDDKSLFNSNNNSAPAAEIKNRHSCGRCLLSYVSFHRSFFLCTIFFAVFSKTTLGNITSLKRNLYLIQFTAVVTAAM